ncbi:MAG TPA: sigma-70 family RNA polymerase sigma factor [Pyrinomonadaceae bacterium]|nr:sigma-70 family RNA polymerase sigma factor [Pyrinomonadaceae bacterium]
MREEPLRSEGELVARARGGDAAAFCALAARYERRVYSLALHYCRNPSDAEDLSQEVWLRAYRSLAGFRGDSSFYTWLRRIAVNAFLNGQESARRRNETRPAPDTDERRAVTAGDAAAGTAAASLDDKLLTGEVWRALGELPRQQRLVFLLKHQEGMTYDEIARTLDCSTGTAKKALFRAVARLRARFCAEAEDEEDEAGDAATALSPCAAREGF